MDLFFVNCMWSAAFCASFMMNRLLSVCSIALILLVQSACFEPTSGCLDVAATNFNASADKDCCCEYPQLVLDVLQYFGDEVSFKENGIYKSPADTTHLFRLKSVTFYLSDVELSQSGNTYLIGDTVQLKAFGASLQDTVTKTFTDDFLLIRRLSLSNKIGDFRHDGTFDVARFRLGLSAEAETVIPRLAPTAHPLHTQADSLWHGPAVGYIFAQIVLMRDTFSATSPDTVSISRADLGDFFIQTNAPVVHKTGYDFHLRMVADYQKMMTGVDLTVHDISAWKTRIIANLPDVFSVSQ